jgi:tyrosyl-tRNA synthetase
MFAKLMSIPDACLPDYFRLVTTLAPPEWEPLVRDRPMEAKKRLAEEVIRTFHSVADARAARTEWERIHSAREIPQDLPEVALGADLFNERGKIWIGRLLAGAGLAKGTGEGRRLVAQGGVYVDGQRFDDPEGELELQRPVVVQIGRRRFARVRRAG